MPHRPARRAALLASGLVLAACMAKPEGPLPDGLAGTDWRAQVHRGRQYLGVWRALRRRGVGPAVPVPR